MLCSQWDGKARDYLQQADEFDDPRLTRLTNSVVFRDSGQQSSRQKRDGPWKKVAGRADVPTRHLPRESCPTGLQSPANPTCQPTANP